LDGVNQKAAEIIEDGIDMGPPTPEDLDDVCASAPFPLILYSCIIKFASLNTNVKFLSFNEF
jgi:hypothetical protein